MRRLLGYAAFAASIAIYLTLWAIPGEMEDIDD